MKRPLRTLLVEDSQDDALLLAHELLRNGYDPIIERVETQEAMEHALNMKDWDVIISDYVLPRFSGIAALETLKKTALDIPFIIVSGKIGEEVAVDAMRAGAHDYVMKSNLRRLALAVERELREAEVRREKKRAEEALQRAHDQMELRVERRTAALAEVNRSLEKEIHERVKIAEELRIGSEKLKMFAYSVAHDLKSPSVGIFGLTRVLRRRLGENLDGTDETICDQIMKASEHVASLVDAINVFIATKENPLRIDIVDTKEVFSMLRDEFSARLKVRGVTFVQPDTVPVIRADKISILRVFRNLIDNALKYGGEKLTEICIDYEKSEGYHHFSIRDDGVGIRAENRAKVFGKFQRESGLEKIEGTGLGLAIVREIAELHKGRVLLEANPTGGTLFHLWIADDLQEFPAICDAQ